MRCCEQKIRVTPERAEQTISVESVTPEQEVFVQHEAINLTMNPIHLGTTAEWNAQPSLVGKKGHIYVYTDYMTVDGEDIPGIKIGDGDAYLIDAPFVSGGIYDMLVKHINDTIRHITAEERTFWNNKVRCYMSEDNIETIIFTTE